MTEFYDRVAAVVSRILTAYGQVGQIQQPAAAATGGEPTDRTGGTLGAAPDPIDAVLAVFPILTSSQAARVDGETVLDSDWNVIVEPIDGYTITEDDTIVCTEGTLTIVRLGKIAPTGTIVAYDMICRG